MDFRGWGATVTYLNSPISTTEGKLDCLAYYIRKGGEQGRGTPSSETCRDFKRELERVEQSRLRRKLHRSGAVHGKLLFIVSM